MSRKPFWRRYARFLGADPAADVADEVRFHLEAHVDELVREGWSEIEARREAERRFGNVQAVRATGERIQRARDRGRARSALWASSLQDLRYAIRTLRRDRTFATIAVLVLGLGIAGNTAVFSVVNTVLLRPLPFPHAEELTWLRSGRDTPIARTSSDLSWTTYTVDAYREIERRSRSFQAVTCYNPFLGNTDYVLTGRGDPRPVAGVMVAGNFFATLGVEPALGRDFTPEETVRGGPPAALVSDAFWRSQLGADPAIIGRPIVLSGRSLTVVGVLPQGFDFGAVFAPGVEIDVFVPVLLDEMQNWGNTLALVGRLRPGVSAVEAQREADRLAPEIKADHPDWFGDYATTVTGLQEHVTGKLRRSLLVLWAAVGLMLLIVAVNLANLVLARAAGRSKEFAMRVALGAGRMRLVRQLLAESVVLAGAGAVVGHALALGVIAFLVHRSALTLPLLHQVRVDGSALAWTLGLATGAALLLGLLPGLGISLVGLRDTLSNAGKGSRPGGRRERTLAMLVTSQVALSCLLLIGAGLLLRSFVRVLDVDLGFEPTRAATMRVSYEDGGSYERRSVVLQEMLARVTAIPGVETAGIADMLPLGRNRSWGFKAQGVEYLKGDIRTALVRVVTPGYLHAMGIRLTSGRDFSWHDGPHSESVVIVNQAAANRNWPGQDPLNRLGLINGSQESRVIGVVADVRDHGLETTAGPEIYLPMIQADPEGAELVVRTIVPPATVSTAVLSTLRALDPGQPVAELRPLRELVDQAVSPRRFLMLLVTGFALFGLLLASLGVYGVISYSVTRRAQEIGVRMAVGATAGRVQLGVIGRAMQLALGGIAIGAGSAVVAARWIRPLLFQTNPADPLIFAGIGMLLSGVALLAAFVPARRAARVSPTIALRSG